MAEKKSKKNPQGDAQDHRYRVLRIGVVMTLVVALFQLIGIFDITELKSLDWRFRVRGPRPVTLKAAIVAIDDESLNGWSDDKNRYHTMPDRWTWPRNFYGKVIDNLREAGAAYVAFDIVFSESTRAHPEEDRAFADASKKFGNVIFAERYVPKDNGSWKTETVITPLDLVKRDKGHILPDVAEDGFLRGYHPLYYNSSHDLDPGKPSLDLALFRQMTQGSAVTPVYDAEQGVIHVGNRTVPLNLGRSVMINYAGPKETFPTFPFHDVFYKTMDMSVFKGKVVYIGSTSEVLNDNKYTPFDPIDKMPGVETHAHMLDTMLSEAYLKTPSRGLGYLLIAVLGLLTSVLTFRVKPIYGAAMMGLIFCSYLVACLFVFVQQGLVLLMVAPLVSVFLSFAAIAVYRGFVEERRARNTRAMFSRYVSKHIVDEIMKNPDSVKLGGEVKEVSILFSDVRGFTAMSERLSAPEVVEVLNEYLTAMVDIVIANDGTLDKYVGDAIMAVWGSPVADPQHEVKSAKTAVQMMEVLHELQAKWKAEGKPEIDIGIGINSGHVVAGNMGHPEYKMDYTVIGDDVNLAARLESANKEMKAHVLISGTTYAACKDLLEVIKHPDIHVKGKEKEVEVYEVVGWKGQGRAVWAVPLKG
jgi:adenylate cyclase